MNLSFEHLLPENFSSSSRVWIYQSNRIFNLTEALQLEKILFDFTQHWTAHQEPVKGYANLFFGQFIILIADESEVKVSGCSTDSSVRLIKEIEKIFHVNLFDRQSLAFIIDDKVQILPISQFEYAVTNGFLQPVTLYFNNTVSTKEELTNNWIIPIQQSWLKSKLPSGIAG